MLAMATSRMVCRSFHHRSLTTSAFPYLQRGRVFGPLSSARLKYGNVPISAIGLRSASTQFLPTILQPSFWRSLMPKAIRSTHSDDQASVRPKAKDWNPATFFIWIFLLIGSQAIQMIALQHDFVQFTNRTETKLSLLREVVERVQNGEDVDVESILGTGDATKEKEWEEVMRELEEEDALIQSRRAQRKAKQAAKASESDQDLTRS